MNSNCLDGMRCPSIKCGSYGPFQISAECEVDISDDGTDDAVNFTWEDDSYCRCLRCEQMKKIGDFKDNHVVVAQEEHEDTPSVVFGPAKKALCDAFFDGAQYVNDSSLELSLRSWDAYASEKEGGE